MKKIKGYKAFEKGLICKGFQYKENTDFKYGGDINICEKGFHFCENPLDILNYYNLCECEIAEVESFGKTQKHNDNSKVVTDKIKIKSKIDLPIFIKASFDFLWENFNRKKRSSGDSSKLASSGYSSKLASSGNSSQLVSSGDSSKLASSGDSSKLASSGDYSQLASSGYSSKLANSGDYSKLASSGYSSQLANSGDYSKLASSGDYSKLASSGYSSKLASSGNSSQLVSSGDYSQLASSGYSSKLELTGINSVGANIGVNGQVKGKKGCWITLAEYDKDYKIKYVKSEKIDGKNIKEDTWYELCNGKFKKVI